MTYADPAAGGPEPPVAPNKKPLYPRLLGLRHVHPNAWQRAALGEGAIGVGILLAMADLASAWTIVVLPVAVAVIVKAHDALQGLLDRTPPPADSPEPEPEPAPTAEPTAAPTSARRWTPSRRPQAPREG